MLVSFTYGIVCLIVRVLSAVINGTSYRKANVVMCGMEVDTPMFGRILELIVTTCQECLFATCPLHTIAFQYHYHAYEAVPMDWIVVYRHEHATVQLWSFCKYKGGRKKLYVCLHQVSSIFLNFDEFHTHAVCTCEQICEGYNLCVL